jgi:lysophospholipid acyltransferase (LPLAT)-like uncharacterized protein
VGIFSSRRIASSPVVQKAAGAVAAEYLRLVWMTNRFRTEPPDIYESIAHDLPVIVAMWHGQHFLMPFIKKTEAHKAKVLVSRHRDGEINAAAAERLGIGTIRGSGTQGQDHLKKGGISAFNEMLTALQEGYTVALTADVPKVARVCGLGIVKLASVSGRAIYPIAVATSRRFEMSTWDRTAVNLPFGRGARVAGDPVRVPADADEAGLECARRAVERNLNAATERAYRLVDHPAGASARG